MSPVSAAKISNRIGKLEEALVTWLDELDKLHDEGSFGLEEWQRVKNYQLIERAMKRVSDTRALVEMNVERS